MNGWGGDHEMYWNETWQFFKMWFGKKNWSTEFEALVSSLVTSPLQPLKDWHELVTTLLVT